MKKDIKINKGYNEEYGEIVKSIEVTKTKDEYNEDESTFRSVFYYEVSKDSGIFYDEIGYCNMSWNHSNPIDYDNFHKNIVPLDWALNTLGYEMLEDESSWRKRLKEDDDFAVELTTRIKYLRPISKEEYYNSVKKV